VLLHLHDSIDFRSFHLYWMPHLLTHDLWNKRSEYAKAMLPFPHNTKRDSWHHFVTSDEFKFFLNTSPRRMWTLSRDGLVTKPRLDIQSKTFMFTIMWNRSGFYAVHRFRNDIKMNSDYLVTNMVIPFKQVIFPRGRAPHQKRLAIHLDNYSVHTSRGLTDWLVEHGMRRTPHSPTLFP
jgi:hypothetical protein